MTSRALLLALVMALPATGWAWEHQGAAWGEAVSVEVADDPVAGLPSGYPLDAISAALTAWSATDCLDLAIGGVTGTTDNPGSSADGRSVFSMNDPFDQVPAGSWAVTVLEVGADVLFTQDGVDYRRITEADVVFSDTADFATDAAIAASCGDEISFAGVAMHEVGHLLGLADACPRGADCAEPLQDATMNWLVAPCDLGPSDLADDDLDGIVALYGPYVPFRCTPQDADARVAGLVPLSATCAIDPASTTALDSVEWDFGDGGGATTEEAAHTWTTAGRYDVTACIDAPAYEACDRFDACPTRQGYIVACTPAQPSVGWDVVDGATIRLVNDTPIPAEGCFDTVLWTLYDGDGVILATLTEWEPVYTFPGPGDYLAVLEIDGPSGYATAQTLPHVTGIPGDDTDTAPPICGCAATGGPSGIAGIALALGLAGVRRCRFGRSG